MELDDCLSCSRQHFMENAIYSGYQSGLYANNIVRESDDML